MEYKAYDGNEITAVPKGARCTYTMKHPDNMTTCPYSEEPVCIPEECGYYKEYAGYERCSGKRKAKQFLKVDKTHI